MARGGQQREPGAAACEASCAEVEMRQRLGVGNGIRSDRHSVVRLLKLPRVDRERPERRQVGRLLTRRPRPAGRDVDAAATMMTRLPEARSEAMTRIADACPATAGGADEHAGGDGSDEGRPCGKRAREPSLLTDST